MPERITRVVDGEYSRSWINGTAPPDADRRISVHLRWGCSPVLSLEWGRDMSMPRQLGGFCLIASSYINEPDSLVTIDTYCDELSSASCILKPPDAT